MEVGEGQELEDNEEIDKMADKDMIRLAQSVGLSCSINPD